MSIQYATSGDIEIAYETFGSPEDPPVILVMGIATQMLGWPEGFCRLLADHGLYVVRFDNRDIGLSTHLHEAGVPDLMPIFLQQPIVDAPYTFADMAGDIIGLIDALGFERVHLVGASLGGMVAQELALRHPERLLSLTSIMSTVGPWVGDPTEAALAVFFSPAATTPEEASARSISIYRVIGSPGFPLDEKALAERAAESFRRANDPDGVARQLAAMHASGDRTERLRDLQVPTLVLHGEADQLVQLAGGLATAEAVPGARLVTYPEWGHDLPQAMWPTLVAKITDHVESVAENA